MSAELSRAPTPAPAFRRGRQPPTMTAAEVPPGGLRRRAPTPPDDLMKWGHDPPTIQVLDRRGGPGDEGSNRAEVADNRRLSGDPQDVRGAAR